MINISVDNYDTASGKIQQLVAMLHLVSGEGFKAFSHLNEGTQDWYLHAMADLADSINDALHDKHKTVEATK